MSRVTLVLARARNGVIGDRGGLPWRIGSDLRRFKAMTLGKPIIMGRATWDSLPKRPLPGRRNIVVTRNPAWAAPGAERAASPEAALALAGDVPEIMVIGGAEIYRAFLPHARRILLTEVDLAPPGDARFVLPEAGWREVSRSAPTRESGDDAAHTLVVLERDGD